MATAAAVAVVAKNSAYCPDRPKPGEEITTDLPAAWSRPVPSPLPPPTHPQVPGPTDPNRQFAMSGTSLGITTNFNGTLYPQQSYLDYLRRNGRSSGGYYDRDLWMLGGFADFFEPENQVRMSLCVSVCLCPPHSH